MAGDATSSGSGADRQRHAETGRADNPWQRIEAEKPQRDAARKAWDAQNDPSPQYEYAIRPLSEDYGKDRPANRDLTEAQRTELAEVFGRPADELLALRDKDPRATHNRDDQGHILDHNGNPRPDKTPEQLLREAQRQANLYGPGADTSRDETEPRDSGTESGEPDEPDGQPEPNPPENLGRLVGQIAADLRAGKLTTAEAAERLEQFRDNTSAAASEPTTETLRTERTADGDRYFQRATPESLDAQPGERTTNEQSEKVSPLRRKADVYAQTGEIVPEIKEVVQQVDSVIDHRLPPGARGETTIRQPDIPTIENRHQGDLDPGNVTAAALAATIVMVVYAQRLRDRIDSNSKQKE